MPKRRPDHQPLRSCAVCREVHPKREMTRIVRRADGSVAFDASGKAAASVAADYLKSKHLLP